MPIGESGGVQGGSARQIRMGSIRKEGNLAVPLYRSKMHVAVHGICVGNRGYVFSDVGKCPSITRAAGYCVQRARVIRMGATDTESTMPAVGPFSEPFGPPKGFIRLQRVL